MPDLEVFRTGIIGRSDTLHEKQEECVLLLTLKQKQIHLAESLGANIRRQEAQ